MDDLSNPFTRGAKLLGIEAAGGDGGYPEPQSRGHVGWPGVAWYRIFITGEAGRFETV
jgi:hypothetical protein